MKPTIIVALAQYARGVVRAVDHHHRDTGEAKVDPEGQILLQGAHLVASLARRLPKEAEIKVDIDGALYQLHLQEDGEVKVEPDQKRMIAMRTEVVVGGTERRTAGLYEVSAERLETRVLRRKIVKVNEVLVSFHRPKVPMAEATTAQVSTLHLGLGHQRYVCRFPYLDRADRSRRRASLAADKRLRLHRIPSSLVARTTAHNAYSKP